MDDLRVVWLRDRVYKAFGLTDPQLFEELLCRDEGKVEDLILHFLNQTSDEEGAATLFFYRTVVPEEVEVETGEPAPPSGPPRPALPAPASVSGRPPGRVGLVPAWAPGGDATPARGPHSPPRQSALEGMVTANAERIVSNPLLTV